LGLVLTASAWAADEARFVLLDTQTNVSARRADAIYLDRGLGQIVVKTLSWDQALEAKWVASGSKTIYFPATTDSLSNATSEMMRSGNFSSEYKQLPLMSARDRSGAKNQLKRLSRKWESLADTAYTAVTRAGGPTLANRESKRRQAFNSVAPIAWGNEPAGYILAKDEIADGGRGDRFQVFINYDTQEMVYRRYSDNRVKEEKSFDLALEEGMLAAHSLLTSKGMIARSETRFLSEIVAPSCTVATAVPGVPGAIDIEAVTDALYENYLQGALSRRMLEGPAATAVVDAVLLDQKVPLRVQMDSSGNLISAHFVDKAKADRLGLSIKEEVNPLGGKLFSIRSKDEPENGPPLMAIAAEDREGKSGELAIYVRGKKGDEGFNYDAFEKNSYAYSFDSRGVLVVGERKRFDNGRTDPYAIVLGARDSNGLSNIFFGVFYSKEGRREYVRDTIVEQAQATLNAPEYRGMFSENEIKLTAEGISHRVAARTGNYTSGVANIKVVAAEESYSAFASKILEKTINTLVAGEDPASVREVVDNVMKEFKACLARATAARSEAAGANCLAGFETDAPAKVGEGVMRLKLAQSGADDFLDLASERYQRCLRGHYYPADQAAKARGEKYDGKDDVKGCLYEGVLNTIELSGVSLIDKELAGMDIGGKKITLSTSEKKRAVDTAIKCIGDKGYLGHGPVGVVYDHKKLKEKDPYWFLRDVNACLGELKVQVGRSVTGNILSSELSAIEAVKSEDIPSIREVVMKNGFDRCLDLQRDIQATLHASNDHNKKRHEQMGASAPAFNPAPVEELNPALCATLVTSLTLRETAERMIKEELGEDIFAAATADAPANFLTCFDAERARLEDEVKKLTRGPLPKNAAVKARNNANRIAEGEKRGAACLILAAAFGARHGTGKVVGDLISKDPKLSVIQLNDATKKLLGEKVEACFKRRLAPASTVSEVTGMLAVVREECSAELMKDKLAQDIFFAPVIKGALSNAGLPEETVELLAPRLMTSLGEDIKNEQTLDAIMAKADAFKAKAIFTVMDYVIEEKIATSIGVATGDPRAVAIRERTVPEILAQNDLRGRLERAIASGNEAELAAGIDELKATALLSLAPEIVRNKGEELRASGVLKTDKEVEDMVAASRRHAEACINDKRGKMTGDELLAHCTRQVTDATVKTVVVGQLDAQLEGSLGKYLTPADHDRLVAAVAGETLSAQLLENEKIVDKQEKQEHFDGIILGIKANAARELVKTVVPKVLDDLVATPARYTNQQRRAYAILRGNAEKGAREFLDRCLSDMEQGAEGAPGFEECLNRFRHKLISDVLPLKVEEVLRFVLRDEVKIGALKQSAMTHFGACSRKLSFATTGTVYESRLDACLIDTVFNLGPGIIDTVRNVPSVFERQSSHDIAALNECLINIKKKAGEKVGLPLSELSQAATGGESYLSKVLEASKAPGKTPLTLNYFVDEMQGCIVTSAVPTLLTEMQAAQLSARNPNKLSGDEADLFNTIRLTVTNVATMKTSKGEPVFIDFNSLKRSTSAAIPAGSNEPAKSLQEMIEGFLPNLGDVLGMVSRFDKQGAKDKIAKLERDLKALVERKNGRVDIKDINAVLANSELIDLVVKAYISHEIMKEVPGVLSSKGADPALAHYLSSKAMMERLFGAGNPAGVRAINDIKQKWLLPVLNGELKGDSAKLPANLVGQAKLVLANDTAVNGFAETILGGITQKSLDDQRPKNVFTMSAAGWMGYQAKDFTWGHRFDRGNSNNLRYQPSGKKAVEVFSKKILGPKLSGTLTPAAEAKATKEIEDLVKEAMGENPWP
jgi:hypothetical protein